MAKGDATVSYDGPAGGWGSLRGIARIAGKEGVSPGALATLLEQNKPGGFACVSCAWTKPVDHHPVEFCENGAKATLWELTSREATPDVFARHTVTELKTFSDYDLEQLGRLTHPMRYDRASDHYVPCSWDEAFAEIGRELKGMDPKKTVFYTSGRASLETSYCWALFARAYGHNNLPDSSNMCHETTSVTLKKVIGSPVGTVVLDDFKHCDAIFFFGQNTGSNSPRFLHVLQAAVRRGCRIVTFNPVRERGLESMINPQEPTAMVTGHETALSCQYHQVKPGGDIAVLLGLCKHVLAADDAARADGRHVIDRAFIAEHTVGFEEFEARVRAVEWAEIERVSGLTRGAIEAAGAVYVEADKTIGIYGMGLTQHVHGFENISTYVNLLLMKGNIGRQGAGISPVRGHSNVQGQRTVGIAEKPELVPLDRLAEMFDFTPPREKGLNTVEACEGILKGEIDAFIGLGGNFLRAVPEQKAMEEAWPGMRMTVQIATKLNRGHLFNGEVAYLLPCLGRSEMDHLTGKPQVVTMEDSLSCVHGSVGKRTPASEHLKSEIEIVSRIAEAVLPQNPKMPWGQWARDTAMVRDLIEKTYPEQFRDFNARIFTPGGFYRGNSARERHWKTESGKAEFVTPDALSATGYEDAPGRMSLITMRSNDQFNTTVYGYSDRLRGIEGKRDVLLISPREIERHGLTVGERVALVSDAGDGIDRRVGGLEVMPFDLPDGCVGGYYPELNPLVPLSHHDRASKTPAYKSVPVRIERGG
ncbi:molybdopterin-dependent oxidoreductase alpha subunit [Rhizobium rosettiformans]|uniref:FdhF/YdeP family oxidoreductase n=2 Tax=Rhizobium rosettiformans TaxID=1368430 RepID=A0A4V6T6H2_9HYPH|nr:FdhF/YdeP family oxidoreductase [Rhizobium rosettiformans]MBB5277683.1 molybdopterin-dependent oxidoreductase alpha subunit [Rhizobium rosettiformans]THV33106.1 FdhF/YdeP family oxidoreductase [Rhizobium rosettiformans W3]